MVEHDDGFTIMSAEDEAEELIDGINVALDLQAQRRVNCEIKGWNKNEKIQRVYAQVKAKVNGIQQFIKDFYVIEDINASI